MEYLEIGKLVNTQGIKGEVRVQSETDFPEKRFKKGNTVYAFPKNKPGEIVPLEIDGVRTHKNFVLLHFKGDDNINDIEWLKPSILKIKKSQRSRADLNPGEYYYDDIIGLDVYDLTNNHLGKIKDIMALGSNDVWVVDRDPEKDLLLPKIDDVVKDVDLENGKVTVDLLEGLE